ncbi:MAG: hypothetical protein WCS99_22340, partial [Limisphaerales bacterium]
MIGTPSRIAGIYAACAGAGVVVLSLAMSLGGPGAGLWADIGKGLLFVALSTGLVHVLLRRELARKVLAPAVPEAAQA